MNMYNYLFNKFHNKIYIYIHKSYFNMPIFIKNK